MRTRVIGIVALVGSAWLVIGNLTHPVGSTEMYTDGTRFVEHADTTYWVVNHLLLAIAILVVPWVAWAWWKRLSGGTAQAFGAWATMLVTIGSLLGALHLGGIDGVAIPAYSDVLAAGGAGAEVGADVLLKVHLASITAWSIVLWGGAQAALGVAELLDGRRRILGILLLVCAALGFVFAFAIALEGHLTSVTEGVLFRASTVGLTIWLLWTAWELFRSDDAPAIGDR